MRQHTKQIILPQRLKSWSSKHERTQGSFRRGGEIHRLTHYSVYREGEWNWMRGMSSEEYEPLAIFLLPPLPCAHD